MAAEASSVLVLLGPTATGKTAVGVEVARRIGGEVISADSRAFFRGLDIVTAKPTPDERGGVAHHLIDSAPVDGSYDAMAFRRDVDRLIPQIRSRGHVPLLVGGGTLYLGAVLRGIFDGPAKDERLRRRLADVPAGRLHERLQQVDPAAAAGIHPHDRLRIVRALEVYEATGRPISDWQSEARPLPYDFVVFGLTRERTDHRAAIASRVREMIQSGLLREVRRRKEEGLNASWQAYRTVGVPEAIDVLEGRATEEEMETTIVSQTWSLARRQAAWFRRDRAVDWLNVTGRSVEDVATTVIARWEERSE